MKFEVYCDAKTNHNPERLKVLLKCLRYANLSSNIIGIQSLPSREVVIIQLCDLLLGAANSRLNDTLRGWDKKKKRYDPSRRVSVLYENFVVIIAIRLKKGSRLTGNFITCFNADQSIEKIKNSPIWTREACLEVLNKKGR